MEEREACQLDSDGKLSSIVRFVIQKSNVRKELARMEKINGR